MDSYSNLKISVTFAARPTFYKYVFIMFIFSAISLFACGVAGIGAGLGNW
jgi:hypothetical protein